MTIKDNMKQIPVIIPERIKELLEEDAKENNNSRSGFAAFILIDYYKKQGRYED